MRKGVCTVRRLVYTSTSLMSLFSAHQAMATYSCNVSLDGTGALYSTSSNVDTTDTLTLNCSRASGDSNSLTYRIKANTGINPSGNQRRVRLGSSGSNYINYRLTRGASVGGSATCASSTNWLAPSTGTSNVITGTLSFGSNLTASAVWGYCIRLPSGSSPTAGQYVDTVQVFAQYPNSDAGTLTASVPLTFTAGVGNQCVFRSFPATVNFAYTSFSPTDQVSTQTFDVRCSNSLAWTMTVSPASSTLLGLNYNFGVSPSSGTGTGLNQTITLTGTVPAGQAGTCSNAVCTATQTHSIIISY